MNGKSMRLPRSHSCMCCAWCHLFLIYKLNIFHCHTLNRQPYTSHTAHKKCWEPQKRSNLWFFLLFLRFSLQRPLHRFSIEKVKTKLVWATSKFHESVMRLRVNGWVSFVLKLPSIQRRKKNNESNIVGEAIKEWCQD